MAVTTKAAEQRQKLNLQDALYSKSQQSEKVDLEAKQSKQKNRGLSGAHAAEGGR